jgi:uncharacterized protein YutD
MSDKKVNKGHKNVDNSEEKKAAATARIDKRISLLENLISERETRLASMEGLPTKLKEFTDRNDWIVGDVDLESMTFSRGTYYQEWNIDKFEKRLNGLFKRIKNPNQMEDEISALNERIDELVLINTNLMEANHKLDQKLSREVSRLKSMLKASLQANKRLHDQLQSKADVVPFNPKG